MLLEKYEVVEAIYHGFDYARGLAGTRTSALWCLLRPSNGYSIDSIRLQLEETIEDGKQREIRRYQDAVLALSKAFALASASDEARDIRDEVGFFQTVRVALVKSADGAGQNNARSLVCNPTDIGSRDCLNRNHRYPRCRRHHGARFIVYGGRVSRRGSTDSKKRT